MRLPTKYQEIQMDAQTPLEAILDGGLAMQGEAYPAVYYWFWLAEVLGAGSAHAGAVLAAFGDARAAYQGRETVLFATLVGKKVAARVLGKVLNPAACAARVEQCAAQNIHVLTVADADYPPTLLGTSDLPLVLYCTGSLAALQAPAMVGMVGTRNPSAYGVKVAARFGGEFASAGAAIISGLAEGLDAECHRAALGQQGITIGVLGTPITRTFPAANLPLRRAIEAGGGLTISEYPPAYPTGKTRSTFLQRNRIIAALSGALVVVEAQIKSGTMSTVAHAERYGKLIFAVPGGVLSAQSGGTNLLLSEGRAKLLLQSSDVLSPLGLKQAEPTAPLHKTAQHQAQPGASMDKQLLACLCENAMTVNELAFKLNISPAEVANILTELEVTGQVTLMPGLRYTIQ